MKHSALSIFSFSVFFLFSNIFIFGQGNALKMAPAVEYSADQKTSTKQGEMKSKVYFSAGKQRMEIPGTSITITRRDKKVVWTIMPRQKMYMEHAIGQGQGMGADVPVDSVVESTNEGSETINGVSTTRYRLVFKNKVGEKTGSGFTWLDKNNIAVKSDYSMKNEKGENVSIRFELSNIKIGKLDPSLFEIPDGYSKMDMSNPFNSGAAQEQKKDGKNEQSDKKEKDAKKNKIPGVDVKDFLPF